MLNEKQKEWWTNLQKDKMGTYNGKKLILCQRMHMVSTLNVSKGLQENFFMVFQTMYT